MTAAPSICIAPIRFVAIWTAALLGLAGQLRAADESPANALFNKYCLSCHGEDAETTRVRLDQLKPDFSEPQAFAN